MYLAFFKYMFETVFTYLFTSLYLRIVLFCLLFFFERMMHLLSLKVQIHILY